MENITLIEWFIKFYSTFTISDLYGVLDGFDIMFLLNWQLLTCIGIVIALLYSPVKSMIATILIYGFLLFAVFGIYVILRNSVLTAKENFALFIITVLLVGGYYMYNLIIKG